LPLPYLTKHIISEILGENCYNYANQALGMEMSTLEEIKDIIQQHKEELKKDYGVKEIGIFGSYVRREQKNTSDVDILIELEKPVGFVKFLKLEKRISDLLGVRVDLVTKKALKPYIGQRILQEVQYV